MSIELNYHTQHIYIKDDYFIWDGDQEHKVFNDYYLKYEYLFNEDISKWDFKLLYISDNKLIKLKSFIPTEQVEAILNLRYFL